MISQTDRHFDPRCDDRDKEGLLRQPGRKSIAPLRRLSPFLTRHKLACAGALVALTAAAIISLALPMAVRRMIDNGFAQTDGGFINRYFVMLMVVAVALAIASAFRYKFVIGLGERIVADLRQEVFGHITRLPASFFDATRSGEISSRLTADTTQVKAAVSLTASVALRNSMLCVGGVAMMFVTSPRLSMMTLVAIPLIVVPLVFFGRCVRTRSRAAQDCLAQASAFASEIIAANRTVQAFNGEDAAQRKYAADVELAYESAAAAIRARSLLTGFAITLIFGSVVGVLWVGAHDVLAGALTPGALSQFLLYSVIAAGSLGSLSEVWGELAQAAGAAERLFELLDEPTAEAPATPTFPLPRPAKGTVEVNDVRFAYPGAPEASVLNGLSLQVKAGETVAVVGPSGGGKSTILSLLLKFYEPGGGSILFDGRQLSSLSAEDVRKEIAVVPQDVTIFAASIFDNIAFGRPDATREAVVAAAMKAQAHDFISKLEKSYDTVVGERGMTLSGGQRQRIAIARAILRDATILLLDEATSALDAENEAAVQDALESLMRGKTTLVIAHRLATVLKADRILVVDEGRVVEEGTHSSLLRKGGNYARLAALQFGETIDTGEVNAA